MNKLDVWDAYWWDAWFELSKGGAMRLKQHREDIKDLKLMNDAHVQDIARRYMNLIRMAEDSVLHGRFDELDQEGDWRESVKRVLKDAEK